MAYNRKDFLKVSGAGIAGLSLMQRGCSVEQVKGYASGLKINGPKEVIRVCPPCSKEDDLYYAWICARPRRPRHWKWQP